MQATRADGGGAADAAARSDAADAAGSPPTRAVPTTRRRRRAADRRPTTARPAPATARRRPTPTDDRRTRRRRPTTSRRRRTRRRRAVREAPLRAAARAEPDAGRPPRPRPRSVASRPPSRRRHRGRRGRRAPTPRRARGARGRRRAEEPVERRPGRAHRRATPRSRRSPTTSRDRAKRALQDEQNDVLDGLRRQRGKIDIAKVLPPLEEQLARWAHVLQPVGRPGVRRRAPASDRRRLRAPAQPAAAPRRAAHRARDRGGHAAARRGSTSSLESIDARTPADTEIAIAQRLGARYREWRGQDLEAVLGDALGGGLRARRRTTPRPTAPGCAGCRRAVGQVPRLRRQRARADGAGRATSRPGSRTRPRTPAVAACSWSTPPDADPAHVARSPARASRLRARCASPPLEPRRRFRLRGWIIGAVVVLVVLLFSLRGPRRLLHRLPLVRLARAGRAPGAACSRPRSRPRSCSRSSSS